MLHSMKKSFGTHKVKPAEKTSNSDFDVLYMNFKLIDEEVKALNEAMQGVGAGWKKLQTSNIQYVVAYEKFFQTKQPTKKQSKKQKKSKVAAVSVDSAVSVGREELTGHLSKSPKPVVESDDFLKAKNSEHNNILRMEPTALLNSWHDKSQTIVKEDGKLPSCRLEIKNYIKLLEKIHAQVVKRNGYVKELDYYRAKVTDCEHSKNSDTPKAKTKLYKAEAQVKALTEAYEEQERICITNMNKAIELKQDIALRATMAFYHTQMTVFSMQPFNQLYDNFLKRHSELDPNITWEELDMSFVEQAHKVKANQKGGAVRSVSLESENKSLNSHTEEKNEVNGMGKKCSMVQEEVSK